MDHRQHQDDDHNDPDNNFLGRAFSNFQHETSNSISYEVGYPSSRCSKFGFDRNATVLAEYIVKQLYRPPILYRGHYSLAFLFSQSFATHFFRGPPLA